MSKLMEAMRESGMTLEDAKVLCGMGYKKFCGLGEEAFCPTGPGGGQDPSCGKGGGAGGAGKAPKAPKAPKSKKAPVNLGKPWKKDDIVPGKGGGQVIKVTPAGQPIIAAPPIKKKK
jgi:hypothetical protein